MRIYRSIVPILKISKNSDFEALDHVLKIWSYLAEKLAYLKQILH